MNQDASSSQSLQSRFGRWLIILSPIFTVSLFGERIVTTRDAANFCLTLRYGFDLASMRPHAPGYPLMVALWNIPYRLLQIEPHTAILIVNTFLMIVAVAAIGRTYRLLWDDRGSMVAMLLLASAPLFVYNGCTGEMYVFSAACSLVVFNTFYAGSGSRLILYALLFGVLGGFRTSDVIFLAPLVLFILWERRRELDLNVKHVSWMLLAFFVGWALWFVPLVTSVGGISSYWSILRNTTSLPSKIPQNLVTVASILIWLFIPSLFFVLRRPSSIITACGNALNYFTVWLLPPMTFFLLRFYSKGYILIAAPIYLLCLARLIVTYYPKSIYRVTYCIVSLGFAFFLFVPFVHPGAESFLAHSHRTFGERAQTSLLRLTSSYAPTNSHLRAGENMIAEALRAVHAIEDTAAVVIVDPSADESIPRCLQELDQMHRFARLGGSDTTVVEFYSRVELKLTEPASLVFSASDLYLMYTAADVDRYRQVLATPPMYSGAFIAISHIDRNRVRLLRDFLAGLYIDSGS